MDTEVTSTGPSADMSSSYDTALCIIPPKHLWTAIDNLRVSFDPAYKKWPPHINIVYPFVPVDKLHAAPEPVMSMLQQQSEASPPVMQLDGSGFISKDGHLTYFLYNKSSTLFKDLRERVLFSLNRDYDEDDQMYMTVGRTADLNDPMLDSMLNKLDLLPTLQWKAEKIHILIRDTNEIHTDKMRLWGEIDLASRTLLTMQNPVAFYEDERAARSENEENTISESPPLTRLPYLFHSTQFKWIQLPELPVLEQVTPNVESLIIANYNVHAEFQHPPSRARNPIIIQNLLEAQARADVLVLKEVTDDFLSCLCKYESVREVYPFISHGPPDQPDIEPLPNHLNIVVLSRWPFSWDCISLSSTCKGFIIMQFPHIGKLEGKAFIPLILSAVHLSPGLTNASITRKEQELRSLLSHLSKTYPRNPWILAGDFNIPTSVYTIETAVKRGEISSQSSHALTRLEKLPMEMGLVDSWVSACVRYGDTSEKDPSQLNSRKALRGEKGPTYDPTVSNLANNTTHSDFDKKPQRYDRILVTREDFIVTGFNLFGQEMGTLHTDSDIDSKNNDSYVEPSHGSDHCGIRCSLNLSPNNLAQPSNNRKLIFTPLEVKQNLTTTSQLVQYLYEQSVLPSDVDAAVKETALSLLKEVIMQDDDNPTRGLPAFVLVPVGSYGQGVWTATSDINCLCIGRISPKTFFALAIQRLRRAAQRGIKILRRSDAPFGPVLELAVGHVKMDLQYCSAVSVAETWPAALMLPSADPMFNLPHSTLGILKPVRDMDYLRRTTPDLAAFRLAYYVIKCWANRRGIYAARLGYLGGIQISILLSRICKLLLYQNGSISVPMILATFYHHYAEFDWDKSMVFDPFFHETLSYVRTRREPMVILGFYGPRLNTAQTVSVSTAQTIIRELKRADAMISESEMIWAKLLDENTGVKEFLGTYTTYVKITARFWSASLVKINKTLEWLESMCASLLVEISRVAPEIRSRIWPARFVNQDASEEDEEYEEHYIIGLDLGESNGHHTLNALDTCVHTFDTWISKDEKFFDPKSYWINTTVIPRGELGELRLDNRDWGQYAVEAENEDIGDSEFWASIEEDEVRTPPAKKKMRPSHIPTHGGKLRSAYDILNRIRWDQTMDSSDYVVGYEDRFLGAMERSIDSWKSDTTHEEFIPEHRILYFKRKSDGAVVWHREERRDEIFGSGASNLGR
ncbi:uncharacterized protein F4812DRAFT_424505 [Daldinia caldariorum]|uniref:uncharacterized protein n=1 Tax=Daldinia caldariorum TaxID=326644 RepID=UPI002007DEA1|nr:uncharacterized protein F4812DRAFT_424505 [Daldinia caldariorum]KAI1468733.1 hypothetical protein F4812DRAFT_424505 [Daldinia caldariorum]